MSGETSNADRMRQFRRRYGLNTEAAGRALGLTARAIEDIEQGRSRALASLRREVRSRRHHRDQGTTRTARIETNAKGKPMSITVDEALELAKPLGGGGFKYGDAQGDITHKFALAVIEWYEARKADDERDYREREMEHLDRDGQL